MPEKQAEGGARIFTGALASRKEKIPSDGITEGSMDIFMEHKIMAAGMFVCLVLSIFLKIFLGMLYGHMIKETDNMAITGNKLLKQCKTKFTNCYELNNGISNIPVFVDKFINRLSLGFLSFEMLYHLSGQLMLLSVVFSGAGICSSILEGSTLGEILPFYIVSFMGLYLYFSVSTVVDIKRKKRILRVNLVDYLENHLSPRIHVTRQDMERLFGGGTAVRARQDEGRSGGEKDRGVKDGGEKDRRVKDGGEKDRRVKDGGEKDGREKDRREKSRRKSEAPDRRTVELMPIGNPRRRGEDFLSDYDEEPENISEGKIPGESRESMPFESQGRTEDGQDAGDSRRGKEPADPDSSAAVTEEELEALLKEFLTG